MSLEQRLFEETSKAINSLYNTEPAPGLISFQKTRKEFEGDITLVVFPIAKLAKRSPDETAQQLGNYLKDNVAEVSGFNVVKGFLNLVIEASYWLSFFRDAYANESYGMVKAGDGMQSIMIEYPSPNTNKPLHLGHLRNIFLGYAVSEILKTQGNRLIHACLYNDRGTNISKSMLAWQMYANGATPSSAGIKGDHFVGDYYVKFADAYKAEMKQLMDSGLTEEQAKERSELNKKVNELTVKWEEGDREVRALWKQMNEWVYEGFNVTYKSLGIEVEKSYYESDVYNLGKETVKEGLDKGIFYQKDDGSVWIDLTEDGLDHKLVLRSNGTTVYITQDLAVANEKDKEYKLDKSIYVVGNEQEYHFKVLFLILKKLGRPYANNLYHLSYGMVELPTGKMKSREGTVVDADDLVEEMVSTAREASQELGKMDELDAAEADQLYRTIGLGALKYFILKVDPKKKMVFNPKESIDLNGHTGPFIQYSYARIRSVIRKAGDMLNANADYSNITLSAREKELLKWIYDYPAILKEAADTYSPALVANYIYELAKLYNQFYHDIQILKEENEAARGFRLRLSSKVGVIIRQGMRMLGIEVPERM